MIRELKDLPDNVVGFRATGKVTKEDYDDVVFPVVKKHISEKHPLNYLFFVDTSLGSFSAGAWLMDVWLGLKEIAKWKRVAIVSDDEGIRQFTDRYGHLVPGEYKGFASDGIQRAITWVSSGQ